MNSQLPSSGSQIPNGTGQWRQQQQPLPGAIGGPLAVNPQFPNTNDQIGAGSTMPSWSPPPIVGDSSISTYISMEDGYVEPDCVDCWAWHLLPNDLIYRSYLAGPREARTAAHFLYNDSTTEWVWDSTVGARVGLFRYGTHNAIPAEGWQLDFEAAVFSRLDIDQNYDLLSADYRVGIPLTYRKHQWAYKLALYHLRSNLVDEFIVKNPNFNREEYRRDALAIAAAYHPQRDWRVYWEAGYAFDTDGAAEPWELQFGLEYSPAFPCDGCCNPFFAVNGQLREEVDFGGGFNVEFGYQWQNATSGRTLRLLARYFNGKSAHRSFFDEHEELIGVGLSYDF